MSRPLLLLLAALSFACAAEQPAPRPKPAAKKVERTAETIAVTAERELNAAETSLAELKPDEAQAHLDTADRELADTTVDTYPEAKELRARLSALLAQVPGVREEVRKRELAAAVEAARAKIGAAQEKLDEAIRLIKLADARDEDMEHASKSLDGVRAVLDEAGDLESKDPGYSKFSLGVRKQLAAKKTVIEARKLEVTIARSKTELGIAASGLATAINKLKARDTDATDFDLARKAADELQKLLARDEGLGAKDARFAKYAGQLRDRLGAQRESIDKRQRQVDVERRRAAVDDARRTLDAALAALKGKDPPEAAFEEANKAADAAVKTLEEGASLNVDRDYARYAADMTKRFEAARKAIAARRLAVDVEKQKAQIIAAALALSDALGRVRGKKPAETDFSAALDGVAAVEKSLDESEALTSKDRAFSAYVLNARKKLPAARAEIEKRKTAQQVAEQRAQLAEAVAAAKRSVAKLSTTEELQAAEAAVAALEKVIEAGEPLGPKDAAYSKAAIDGRKIAASNRVRILERSTDLAVRTQKEKVQAHLKALQEALAALDGFSPGEETYKAAAAAVEGAEKELAAGAQLEHQHGAYNAFVIDAQKKLAAAKLRIDKRKLEVSSRERKMLLEDAVAAATKAVTLAAGADATGEQVKDAEAAMKAARDELQNGLELERQDKAYEKLATTSRERVDKLQETYEQAKATVAFREGPLAAADKAFRILEAAEGQPADAQAKAYDEAIQNFTACKRDAASLLGDHPRLAAMEVTFANRKTKAANTIGMCGELAKAAEEKRAKIKSGSS